jgi:plastocyanin
MINRRGFFASVLAGGVAAPAWAGQGHDHSAVDGPLANATVSFGQWQSNPPLDRFPTNNDRTRNGHQLIPNEATIKAGGTVNFIIGGFHHVLVYAPGTQPGDINATLTTTVTNPPGPPLINDPTNRVYRGIDPSTLPLLRGPAGSTPANLQDRVEVVHFANPGRYLVICGVQPHFVNDAMFGWVKVLP